ncbi:hypothetical protein M404DRAFT_1000203 [Pisolithus tinctorius Marx 270]|uniref:Uncharacterized protein n=1 Tax=Pisolithus tinctorius Marx 270 TaxID=870435 RepID=A0A0C3NWG0_PISTI|nr:hypothetical protein M404DRAFT_1000203 [Pisolithus tinctorius Marx 270]
MSTPKTYGTSENTARKMEKQEHPCKAKVTMADPVPYCAIACLMSSFGCGRACTVVAHTDVNELHM